MYNFLGILKGLLIQNDVDTSKELIIQVDPSSTTNTTTTITSVSTVDRTITIPATSGNDVVMFPTSVNTVINKTMDGDDNTFLDIGISSLKTDATGPNKAIVRDGTGVIIDAYLTNANVAAGAGIAVSKIAALTPSTAVVTDGSGFISSSATTATQVGYLSTTTSDVQTQLNARAPTTGALVDNHLIRADGTTNVQSSTGVLDDSGNLSGIATVQLSGSSGINLNNNVISSTGLSVLRVAAPSNEIILQNNTDMLSNPAGTLVGINFYDIQPTPHKVYVSAQTNLAGTDWAVQLPAASGTFVVDAAVQTISGKTFSDAITGVQISTPSNPSAGRDKLYFKSDNRLYTLNPSGTETLVANQYLNVLSKTANYSAAQGDDVILVNTTSGAISVFLFGATSGTVIRVKKTSSDTNRVTVSDTTNLIDGASTFVLNGQYDEVTLLSNGSTWNVVAKYIPTTGSNFIVASNTAGNTTIPATTDTWQNIVGNNVTLNPGTWELNGTLQYGNNGSNPAYGSKYIYWCGATGNNTNTPPATLGSLAGLTVLGGFTLPRIADSSTDSTSVIQMPTVMISLTQQQTIYVGMRAIMTTPSLAQWIPMIVARRLN